MNQCQVCGGYSQDTNPCSMCSIYVCAECNHPLVRCQQCADADVDALTILEKRIAMLLQEKADLIAYYEQQLWLARS